MAVRNGRRPSSRRADLAVDLGGDRRGLLRVGHRVRELLGDAQLLARCRQVRAGQTAGSAALNRSTLH